MHFRFIYSLTAALIAIFSTPSTTAAQTIRCWGVKLGITDANQTISGNDFTLEYSSRIGLSAGIFAEWLNHPWISVNSEICFSQKGHRLDIPITTAEFPDGTGEFTGESIGLNYISIALLPKARIAVGPIELYALAGPRVDFAIGHTVTIEGREPIRSYLEAGWNSNLSHSRDAQIGGDFGVGCTSNALLPMILGAEVRYSPDFTPSSQFPNSSTTNHSWEFLLVVGF